MNKTDIEQEIQNLMRKGYSKEQALQLCYDENPETVTNYFEQEPDRRISFNSLSNSHSSSNSNIIPTTRESFQPNHSVHRIASENQSRYTAKKSGDEVALQLGILSSEYLSNFGVNMYDTLTNADEAKINSMVKQGVPKDEAMLHLFDEKYVSIANDIGVNIQSSPGITGKPSGGSIQHTATKPQSSAVPGSVTKYKSLNNAVAATLELHNSRVEGGKDNESQVVRGATREMPHQVFTPSERGYVEPNTRQENGSKYSMRNISPAIPELIRQPSTTSKSILKANNQHSPNSEQLSSKSFSFDSDDQRLNHEITSRQSEGGVPQRVPLARVPGTTDRPPRAPNYSSLVGHVRAKSSTELIGNHSHSRGLFSDSDGNDNSSINSYNSEIPTDDQLTQTYQYHNRQLSDTDDTKYENEIRILQTKHEEALKMLKYQHEQRLEECNNAHKNELWLLKSDNERKQSDLERANNDRIEMERKKNEIYEDLLMLQAKLKMIEGSNERYSSDISRLISDTERLKADIQLKDSDLRSALSSMNEIQRQSMEEKNGMRTELSFLQNRIQQLEQERLNTTVMLAQKEGETLSIGKDQNILKEMISSLQEAIHNKDKELVGAKEAFIQLEIEKELRSKCEGREESERRERIAAVAQLMAVQSEMGSKVHDIEERKNLLIENLKMELLTVKQQREMLNEEVKNKSDLIVRLDTEVKQLSEALDAAAKSGKAESSESIEKIARMSAEIEILNKKHKEMTEHMENQNKMIMKKELEMEDKLIAGEIQRRKLHNLVQELRGNVRVFARVRPFLPNDGIDLQNPPAPTITLVHEEESLKIFKAGSDVNRIPEDQIFTFDKVFGPSASQEVIFQEVSDLVQSALDGYNVCLFSYGQTGSGKTHTMQGSGNGSMRGVIPRAIQQLGISKMYMEKKGWEYQMHVTFVEIYNESIRDLLRTGSLEDDEKHEIKKDVDGNLYISDVTTVAVDPNDSEQVDRIIELASRQRSVSQTAMNERSSRSHSVFALYLKAVNQAQATTLNGTLSLVDLAGSERLDRSKVTGAQLKETVAINKSLSALTDVFVAIANKQSFIPFRNSKLTNLLQPALSGDGKTMMMVNLSPTEESFNESLCSLRLARQINQCELGKAKRQVKSTAGTSSNPNAKASNPVRRSSLVG
eukprot:gene5260-7309_t